MSESNIERSRPERSERERRASHQRQHRRESSPELECCRHCGSPLVELVESAECGDGCAVLLRCPECFAFERVRCSAAELDRYEDVLDEACHQLVTDLVLLEEANMREYIELFHAALAREQILPEDF